MGKTVVYGCAGVGRSGQRGDAVQHGQRGVLMRTVLVLLVVSTVCLAVLFTRPGGAAAQPGQILEGSWLDDVTNAETGARQITFYTFTSDGGLISSNRDHPTRGPAHGAWIRTGDRQFAITFVRLRFATDGTFIGMQKLRGTITLNESLDEFDSVARNEFYDVDGTFMNANSTSSHAKRIKVEPLP